MARKKPTPKSRLDDQALWVDHYETLPDHMDLPADAETSSTSRQQEQKTIATKYPAYDQTLIKPLPGASVLRYAHASISAQLFKKVFQSRSKRLRRWLHHHSGKSLLCLSAFSTDSLYASASPLPADFVALVTIAKVSHCSKGCVSMFFSIRRLCWHTEVQLQQRVARVQLMFIYKAISQT